MEIAVSDLRTLTAKLFSHLERIGRTAVVVPGDYYWDIPRQSRYDPSREPGGLSLGQLTDDWNELLAILQDRSEPLAYAFVWLSAILRAIGEEVVE